MFCCFWDLLLREISKSLIEVDFDVEFCDLCEGKMATTLIHSVRIFDGESLIAKSECIILSSNAIHSISLTTPSPLPSAEIVIDGTNHTVLPGVIDAHVHAHESETELQQALGFEVTTVLDMFSHLRNVKRIKGVMEERDDVADYRSACFGATIEEGWPAPVVRATMGDAVSFCILLYCLGLGMGVLTAGEGGSDDC